MLKFEVLTAVAAPLLRANVDTDAIIPSREMKSVSKTGLAAGLFAGWRYKQIGGREPDPDPRVRTRRVSLLRVDALGVELLANQAQLLGGRWRCGVEVRRDVEA